MDRKRRRTGAIAHSHGNCDTDGFGHAELNSTSYSSRTAASDTRTSPDTLSSVAASRTVIFSEGWDQYRRGATARLRVLWNP